jgi:hypothetical protein
MRTILVRLAMAIFCLTIIGVLFGKPTDIKPVPQDKAASAAYRDGLFLGKRDAVAGSKPSPLKSRWSAGSDREAFAQGYFRGYMIDGAAIAKTRWAPQSIDNQGFADGRLEGMLDRENAREFDLASKEKFRNPAGACAESENDSCTQAYRDAYATGYQHGYYQPDGKTAQRTRISLPQNV